MEYLDDTILGKISCKTNGTDAQGTEHLPGNLARHGSKPSGAQAREGEKRSQGQGSG